MQKKLKTENLLFSAEKGEYNLMSNNELDTIEERK